MISLADSVKGDENEEGSETDCSSLLIGQETKNDSNYCAYSEHGNHGKAEFAFIGGSEEADKVLHGFSFGSVLFEFC